MSKPTRGPGARLWLALLLLLFLVFTLLSALVKPAQEKEILTNRSVYNTQSSGIRAWYLTARKAGLPVYLWRKPFDRLKELPTPSIMLLVEPYSVGENRIVFSRREVAPLLDWVAKGNTVIFLDEFRRPAARQFLTSLRLSVQQQGVLSKNGHTKPEEPQAPKPFSVPKQASVLKTYQTAPVYSTITWRNLTSLPFKTIQPPKYEVLLETPDQKPALIRLSHGDGWVYAGTAADLISNEYLHKPENDNFQFISNLVAVQQKPLFINEFVHGYVEAADIFAYYRQKTPLGKVFMQFAFAFTFVLWLSFIPWRPRQLLKTTHEAIPDSKQVDLKAFIESMAGIFYKTRSAPLAVEPQLARIETLLRRRYHVQLSDLARVERLLVSYSGRYSSKDESPEALLLALRKATEVVEKQQHLPHRELLRLVQQLIVIEDLLASHGYAGRITGTTRTEQHAGSDASR